LSTLINMCYNLESTIAGNSELFELFVCFEDNYNVTFFKR